MQAFSGSAVSILAPALVSFAVAFLVLLCLIRLPAIPRREEARGESLVKSCLIGVRYLRDHGALLRLTLFFAIINFLAKIGNDGMLAPFILGRSGNNQQALGMVQSAVSLGILAGSLVVAVAREPRSRVRTIFLFCGFTCLGNVAQSLTTSIPLWCLAAFASYLSAAVMNAHLTAIMRANVPLNMQGRVFSAKDTLQNCTIPLGLFLGGFLADHAFEPFMASDSPLPRSLSRLFGTGSGSGIALIFFAVGMLGALLSFTRLRKPSYHSLEK